MEITEFGTVCRRWEYRSQRFRPNVRHVLSLELRKLIRNINSDSVFGRIEYIKNHSGQRRPMKRWWLTTMWLDALCRYNSKWRRSHFSVVFICWNTSTSVSSRSIKDIETERKAGGSCASVVQRAKNAVSVLKGMCSYVRSCPRGIDLVHPCSLLSGQILFNCFYG